MSPQPTIKGIEFPIKSLEGKTPKETLDLLSIAINQVGNNWISSGHGNFTARVIDKGDSIVLEWEEVDKEIQEIYRRVHAEMTA